MVKLRYWVARCRDDHYCYSLRAKTKAKVEEMLANGYDPKAFDPPKRVEVEYYGAFDLLTQAVGEGGPYWEE